MRGRTFTNPEKKSPEDASLKKKKVTPGAYDRAQSGSQSGRRSRMTAGLVTMTSFVKRKPERGSHWGPMYSCSQPM